MFKKMVIASVAVFLCTVFFSSVYAQNKELMGAGATFPYPLYSKMFDVYKQEYNVTVNYQAIGSGGGIQQLMNKTVDFGATDAFLSEKEMEQSPDNSIVHIPVCLGAVVVTYNIPGNPALQMTPEVLEEIFLGTIKKWNDTKIQAVNPQIKLPSTNITVVTRSDGSGTTFIFTDYLTKVSTQWAKTVGTGKSVNFPVGLGAKGNAGVAGMIKVTPGSIGYVELIYALQNKMAVGIVKNKSGSYIKPTLESVSAAAAVKIPDDTRVSLTNTDAPQGYPISSFTWIILFKEQNYNSRSKDTAKTLVEALWWIAHQGQKYAAPLEYSPLPKSAVEQSEKLLKSITYNGTPILK